MSDIAKLILPNNQEIELPIITGSENEKGIDISSLRSQTGYVTLDPSYGNTASCTSNITYINGEEGILRHRGYDIKSLTEKFTFIEVAYLLIYGNFPNRDQLYNVRNSIRDYSLVHEDMKKFFSAYPSGSHPMAILSSMVCSLSAFHPELIKTNMNNEEINLTIAHLMSKVRVLAAYAYKRSIGQKFIYPRNDYDFVENFLHMMFTTPLDDYEILPEVKQAMEVLFILHADHEQNCSTSTVRMVGSSHANMFASISSGVCALWGPRHGGANQKVIEMLDQIVADGGDYKKWLEKAKDKNDPFKLMGFGHRVYKNYDPRAKIIKTYCDDLLNKLGVNDKTLEVAKKLEEAALNDPYFVDRKLFPNVDFYSGIIYRAIGFPTDMFTVLFAIGRMPGWIAQWNELMHEPGMRISRPRQIYTGPNQSDARNQKSEYTSASVFYKNMKKKIGSGLAGLF